MDETEAFEFMEQKMDCGFNSKQGIISSGEITLIRAEINSRVDFLENIYRKIEEHRQ